MAACLTFTQPLEGTAALMCLSLRVPVPASRCLSQRCGSVSNRVSARAAGLRGRRDYSSPSRRLFFFPLHGCPRGRISNVLRSCLDVDDEFVATHHILFWAILAWPELEFLNRPGCFSSDILCYPPPQPPQSSSERENNTDSSARVRVWRDLPRDNKEWEWEGWMGKK